MRGAGGILSGLLACLGAECATLKELAGMALTRAQALGVVAGSSLAAVAAHLASHGMAGTGWPAALALAAVQLAAPGCVRLVREVRE